MNFPSGTAVLGLTRKGRLLFSIFIWRFRVQKDPEGHFPRSNGTQKKKGPSGPISAAVRLRLLKVSIQKLHFIFVLLDNRPNHGGGGQNVLMAP
jgi:hypothetical protein